MKIFRSIPALCCLSLLLVSPRPAAGEERPVFVDPLRHERMPWLAAAEAGNRLWEEGDEEGAIREWERAVDLGFTDGIAFYHLGRYYVDGEDWKKAVLYLRSALPRLEHSEADEQVIQSARELLALAYRHQRQYLESYLHYLQALRTAPDSPSIHLGMAQLFLLWGKLDDAERSARRAMETAPGSAPAARILAGTAKRRGDYAGAAEYYRVYLEAVPDDWEARLDRGLILASRLGRDQEAERELAEVLRNQSDQVQAWAALAGIHFRRGDGPPAAAAANRALESDPDNYLALTVRGRLRFQEGDLPGAERDFLAALRAEPEGAMAIYGLGLVHFQKGQYGEAESRFRRALGLTGDFPEAELNRGLALDALGRREEALKVLEKLVKEHPELAAVQLGLGRIYFYSGRFDRALAFLRNALALDPAGWEARYFIGKCLLEEGDRAGAREYFLSARQRGGARPALLTDLARVYQAAGEFEAAEAALKEALQAAPDYLPALFQLGLLQARRDRGEEASGIYRQALVIKPGETSWDFVGEERDFFFRTVSDLEEYLGAGIDYLSLFALIRSAPRNRKIFTEMIPVLRRQIRAHPRQPGYAHLLGLAFEEAGDLESSEKYYQRALEIDPDFSAAHLSLGELYARTGRTAPARRHLAAVMLLAPESALSPEVRKLLENLPE